MIYGVPLIHAPIAFGDIAPLAEARSAGARRGMHRPRRCAPYVGSIFEIARFRGAWTRHTACSAVVCARRGGPWQAVALRRRPVARLCNQWRAEIYKKRSPIALASWQGSQPSQEAKGERR